MQVLQDIFDILINISIPNAETATAVRTNTPGAAKHIIQSVIFIVAAKTDSKKLYKRSVDFTNSSKCYRKKITANTIIGTISPAAIEERGFLGINPNTIFKRLPFELQLL